MLHCHISYHHCVCLYHVLTRNGASLSCPHCYASMKLNVEMQQERTRLKKRRKKRRKGTTMANSRAEKPSAMSNCKKADTVLASSPFLFTFAVHPAPSGSRRKKAKHLALSSGCSPPHSTVSTLGKPSGGGFIVIVKFEACEDFHDTSRSVLVSCSMRVWKSGRCGKSF